MKWTISYIANRHSKAKIRFIFILKYNSKKYIQSYDVIEPTKFILYLDANNLYGGAMSEYLHYGRFNWLNKTKLINSV